MSKERKVRPTARAELLALLSAQPKERLVGLLWDHAQADVRLW
jgi:hypothetical protein